MLHISIFIFDSYWFLLEWGSFAILLQYLYIRTSLQWDSTLWALHMWLEGKVYAVKLEHLKLSRWWKLYLGYNTLVYFIPGESCYFFTLSSPSESLTFSPYSTLPLYVDVTLLARDLPRRIFQSIKEHFAEPQLVAKPFVPPVLYTSLSLTTLTDNTQHIPAVCWLRAWSLQSCEISSHFPWKLVYVYSRQQFIFPLSCIIHE